MSVRQEKPTGLSHMVSALDAVETAQAIDDPLGEGKSMHVANEQHPLTRNLVVSIRSSLNDFCLQKSRATWAPSQEALRNICAPPCLELRARCAR